MSEKNSNISPELWAPLEQDEKNAEKMERPSLTFLQDGWRRLKSNKIAILSLVVIIVLTIGAIFIPMFWKYDYKTQDLELANIPVVMKVYPLENGKNIYVTPQYTVIVVDEKGNLEGLAETKNKDMTAKKNYFDVEGSEICVDYSTYSEASKEFKKIEKKAAKKGLDKIDIKGITYLEEYFAGTDTTEVTVEEAKNILENKIQRTVVSCDGEELTNQEKLRNKTYLLGTDGLGRDLFIRIVYGARISLLVGFFAAFINFVVGVFYGAIAGYFGGAVDNIMMRVIDVLDSIPMTLYVILIMVVVGPGITSIILALGLTFWVKMARIVRGQVLTLKQQEFVKAAIVTGADTKRIIIKHLIPNMMGPIMVNIAMQIPSAIFNEAFLSFVGLGISAPMASWGTLCNDALAGIYVYPYQMVFPAIAISVTILTFNLFSDGLRDAFDPKQRK
ncbi:ABC transporter permease [Coprococcus sp. AF21-14LB]|uniref:ABC transporter permease n=1 Tax=Coprococcus sp. AF21-14LB TaxID=2292231 RepID=UPI000E510983|nr:ABC transporter permease [Coprococcus sp. AF21-14LB]RGS80098.1 ABC transporter permease [Coprococcus sp. AF21-14LB]